MIRPESDPFTFRRTFGVLLGAMLLTAAEPSLFAQSDFPPDLPPRERELPPIGDDDPTANDAADTSAQAARILRSIAEAHNAAAWKKRRAVRCEIAVNMGGRERLAGTLTYDYAKNRIRLERPNGSALVFDGESTWSTTGEKPDAEAVHCLRAYAFMLAAPFKLAHPDAELALLEPVLVRGRPCDRVRIVFPSPAGSDAPGDGDDVGTGGDEDGESAGDLDAQGKPLTGLPDWLIADADQQTSRLLSLAYAPHIVQLTDPDALGGPRAVLFDAFQEVDGVLLARRWQFYSWSRKWGVQGQTLGWGRISSPEFVEPVDSWFERPNEDGDAGDSEEALEAANPPHARPAA